MNIAKPYIRDFNGQEIQGQVSFEYQGYEIALSTIPRNTWLDVVVFHNHCNEGVNFSSVEDAIQYVNKRVAIKAINA